MSTTLKDYEIRKALHTDVLSKYTNDTNTLIIDELGLVQGSCRVDIAVINGKIHGYEIKSDADTLERLPSQEEIYSKIFDKATLVVGEKHIKHAMKIVPSWWEILLVRSSKNKKIEITKHRSGHINNQIDAYSLAQLLWRDEVISILKEAGVPSKELRAPKATLYKTLAEKITLKRLQNKTRTILKTRKDWRGR